MVRKTIFSFLMLGLALALSLSACGAAPLKDAYMASGDINDPDTMAKTQTFRTDDDLNVVITLNSHNRELPLYAVFTAPGGETTYPTDTLDASVTAGKVILGLDFEMTGSLAWPEGEWQVAIFIDDEQAKILTFMVAAVETTPAG